MSPRIDILLLAAGRSSRTGDRHKLLAEFEGEPMVRRAARIALASRAERVTVVTGHRAMEVGEVLAGLPLDIVTNGDFADGMATSLVCGFEAIGDRADGVLVMLADQPRLTAGHLDQLIDVFTPTGPGSVVVATDEGRRFNPVIISAAYRTEIAELRGDVGARSVIAAHGEAVREVELGTAASFDIDTPEAVAAGGGRLMR